MSNKLIDLNAMSAYKTSADLKYQDKLSEGNSISLTNGIVSAYSTYVAVSLGSYSVRTSSVVNLANITLAPGNYILMYTCQFSSNANGARRCGFSVKRTNLDGFGAFYQDSRRAVSGTLTSTSVLAYFQVSATSYPNGRTFYFNAAQSSGSTLTAYPRCYYLKF